MDRDECMHCSFMACRKQRALENRRKGQIRVWLMGAPPRAINLSWVSFVFFTLNMSVNLTISLSGQKKVTNLLRYT